MATNINVNQFNQGAIRGQLDEQISHSGVIQGYVSANNGATAINAGDAVYLDPAITVAGTPQFLTSTYNGVAAGYAVYDVRQASTTAPSSSSSGVIQVALFYTGPVLYLIAAATITPGLFLEQASAGGDVVAYGTSSSLLRGWALDYATVGNLTRVVMLGGSKSLL